MLGEAVRTNVAVQLLREPRPPARCVALHDLRLAGSIGADVPEAAAQDACELQPQVGGELADFVLLLVDHVAAGFGVLPLGKAVADRPHAPANAIARVHDGDLGAQRGEIARGREPREARAGHQDRRASKSCRSH